MQNLHPPQPASEGRGKESHKNVKKRTTLQNVQKQLWKSQEKECSRGADDIFAL